jgi:RNA polymerase sigma-70 factor (ECF subfamily)
MPPSNPESSRWFAEEVLPHEPKLRAWLRGRFPGVTDTDDLVQEAYARLMQAHATVPIACPRAFLFLTARNLAHNHQRPRRIERPEGAAEIDVLSVADERVGAPEALAHAEEFQMPGPGDRVAAGALPPSHHFAKNLRAVAKRSGRTARPFGAYG